MPFDFTVNIPSGGGGGPTDPVDPPITGNPQDWMVQGDETGSQNYSIQTYPSSPLAGQAWFININNFTGWPPLADLYRQVEFGIDYGDSGSVYLSNLRDGNRSAGSQGGHVYTSPGTYTVTIVARSPGGKSKTRTITVVVQNPDNYSFDRTAYVSFAGNFSEAPASSATVLHISSLAALRAVTLGGGDAVRYRFRRGETFAWSGDPIDIGNDRFVRVDSFGSASARPIIRANNPSVQSRNDNSAIWKVGSQTNTFFHALNIEFDGGFNPVTCQAPRGLTYFLIRNAPSGTQVCGYSIFNCYLHGVESGVMTLGQGTHNGMSYEAIVNTRIENWRNYGIGGFGGTRTTLYAGNIVAQHPFAAKIGDGKTGAVSNAPDHGPIRSQCAAFQAFLATIFSSANGWSPNGISYGSANQVAIRAHAIDLGPRLTEVIQNVWGNLLSSDSSSVAAGTHSPGKSEQAIMPGYPMHTLVHCNECLTGSQGYSGFFSNNAAGGLRVWNNLCVRLNLVEFGGGTNRRNYVMDLSGNPLTFNNVRNQPMYCGQNTVVILRSVARHGSNAFDFDRQVLDPKDVWNGPNVVYFGNLFHFPSLGNAGEEGNFTLSPGDGFRLVNGSTNGINSVSGNNAAVYDRDGTLRSSVTNAGAYNNTVPSATSVTPPTISAVTIAQISTTPQGNFWSPTGATTNLDDWRVRFDVRWKRNGSNVSAPTGQYTVLPVSGSGAITADVTVANYGGFSTGTSNTINA